MRKQPFFNTTKRMPLRRKIFNRIYSWFTPPALSNEQAIKKITEMLNSDKPCMISRYGSTEIQTLSYFKLYPFLYPLKGRTYHNIKYNSGFFPVTTELLRKFCNLFYNDAIDIDILVTWRIEELFFKKMLKHTTRINKNSLDEFYMQERPWTQALEGKKVLVVHPFAETIENQYHEKREKLFDNPLVLPKFASLTTIKAVQSVAGTPVDFPTWFDALKYMQDEIDKVDYDICILGCGAYGMPLAAHIKRKGKKAVHLGGITQVLFGISGRVYRESPKLGKYINEHFVTPSKAETPQNAQIVEGACYW